MSGRSWADSLWTDVLCVLGLSIMCVLVARGRGPSGSLIQAAEVPQSRIVLGEAVKMGNGSARTWVRVSSQGQPEAVGVRVEEKALEGLPDVNTKHCCDGPEFVLPLPREVAVAPFDHVSINWNPHGHIPEGVYDKPHFDFHFYFISQDERQRVVGSMSKEHPECKAPDADHIPEGYITTAMSFPRMGTHLVDLKSPEFNGKLFTRTLIWGSCDGRITFVEPMITKAFLQSHSEESESIKQPKKYPSSGYYPTSYRVSHEDGAHVVALEGLVLR